MTSSTPNDHIHQWSLEQIGRLDQFAFTIKAQAPGQGSYTICFWFYAKDCSGLQVIANHGNKSPEQTGWSIFIEDQHLIFRVKPDGARVSEIRFPIPDVTSWHHFTGIMDQVTQKLLVYILPEEHTVLKTFHTALRVQMESLL